MAVSGRKVSDFSGSLSKGSAEDFEHNCEPCLAIGQHIEAHGLCVECQEYLCKSCVAYHQRIKATKHHKLLDKDNMDKRTIQSKDSALCTEMCHIHKNEVIKFFCTNHEFLGCTDCITLNHRPCKIDYIPDKCAGIGDSDENRETLRKLDQKMQDMDAVIKIATLQNKEIDASYDHAIKEILKFRQDINDRLDQLQNQILSDADKMKFKSNETVKKVIETCTATSSHMKKFMSSLQDSKTSQQNGQLYITLKQAKSNLMLGDLKDINKSLEAARIQFSFERNTDLEDILIKQHTLGKMSQTATLVTPRKKNTFAKLTDTGDINVRTKSDEDTCRITGCASLSTNKLVLADYHNKKLKVVETQSKVVIEEKLLDSKPWDIAVLPQDQIAVTMPNKQNILIMSTAGKLSISGNIPVKATCRGITYHQGQLYMVCMKPLSVIILNTQGNVNNTLSLNNEIFVNPYYVLLSEDARYIYISDYSSHSVVSVTLQGDISAVYKHEDLSGPEGMMMFEDGSLLVCCLNGTIHHISGDLKQGQTILNGLWYPRSICYNHQDQEVYNVTDCDQLKILKITQKE